MNQTGAHPGKVVTRTANSDGIENGEGVVIGGEFVVALHAAAADAKFSGFIGPGVLQLAKVSAQSWTEGALIYFDAGQKLATTTSSGNRLIGTADQGAANPSSVGYVRLDGVAR